MNQPIPRKIGVRGPRRNDMKRSTLGVKRWRHVHSRPKKINIVNTNTENRWTNFVANWQKRHQSQRSSLQKAEIRFGGLSEAAEASSSTPVDRVGLLVFMLDSTRYARKMADESVDSILLLNDLLCYVRNMFDRVPIKALKCSIVDFSTVDVIVDAKVRLLWYWSHEKFYCTLTSRWWKSYRDQNWDF